MSVNGIGPTVPQGGSRTLAQLIANVGHDNLGAFPHEQMGGCPAETHQLAVYCGGGTRQQCHFVF
jgi:hypothetical protein